MAGGANPAMVSGLPAGRSLSNYIGSGNQSSSQNVPMGNVSSQNVPMGNVSSQNVPMGNVSSQNVPMAAPSQPMGASSINPYQRASMANAGALGIYANPAAAAQGMMNPYQQNVVNKTLRDVGSAAQMGMNTLDAQASQAGAFGGSRHGIAMSEAAKGYQQQALDAVGALNQQGYNQAMNNAYQSAAGLQNVGQQAFGYGQSIQQQQMQQGAMQQAAMQQLIDAAKGQYAGYTGAPQQGLQNLLGAVYGVQPIQGGEKSNNPGLFNYLQLGAQTYGAMK